MRKLLRILTIFFLIFISTRLFASPDVAKPDVHVGDFWSWQHINGLANEKDFTQIEDVIEISDTEIRTRVRVKGKSNSAVWTYNRDWNPVDVGSAQYSPYLKDLIFPLEIGEKWDGTADKMLFSNGKHGKFIYKGEIVAYEKITVPAGTFDAFKVNVVLDATGTDEDANVGNTILNYWYAPAAKRYVKREETFKRDGRVRSKDIYELLEYSLR